MKVLVKIAVSVVAGLLLVANALAADPPEQKSPETYRYFFFLDLGDFDPEEGVGLLGDASGAFAMTLGFGHRLGRYFRGEVEVGIAGREHELPPGTLVSPEAPTLSTAWLSYSIAARVPIGRFEPFVAAGLGSGLADLSIPPDNPFVDPTLEIDDDRGLLLLYRVGFDAAVSKRNRVGIEFREINFEADLGAFTGGEQEIGGNAILVTWRYMFGRQ